MVQWSHETRSDFRDQTVFTVYPNRIWVGKRGNPYHSAEWSWKPEDEWPRTPMPETRGYYRHSDKSLHFYARPNAYDVLRVKKHLAMRGLTVKILDGSLYDRLEKRYAKRDFSRMRSEGVVTRGELIESILEVYADSPRRARKSHLLRAGAHASLAVGHGLFAYRNKGETIKALNTTGAGIHGLFAGAHLGRVVQRDPRQTPYVISKRKGQKGTRINRRKNFQGYLWNRG